MEKQIQSKVKTVVFKATQSPEEVMRGRIIESGILNNDMTNYSHMVELAVLLNRTLKDYEEKNLAKHCYSQSLQLLALALTTRMNVSELAERYPISSPDAAQIAASLSPLLFGDEDSDFDADKLIYAVEDALEMKSDNYLKDLYPYPVDEGYEDAPMGGNNNPTTDLCESIAEVVLGILYTVFTDRGHRTSPGLSYTRYSICIAALVVALRRMLITVKERYGTELDFELQPYYAGDRLMEYSGMEALIKRIYRSLFALNENNEYVDNMFNDFNEGKI